MRTMLAAIVACVPLCVSEPLSAQGPEYVQVHYAKREVQIPMRDGMRLFTAVYSPRDTSQTYPILLTRTQSGVLPYGEDKFPSQLGPSSLFTKAGYIFVYQDIRGRWASEGAYENLRPHSPAKRSVQDIDESTDTYDTIDWLLKNVANHNGRVGHHGMSYRGWLVAAGMIDAHPALKAVSPQAPIMDWFVGDDWRHNGALYLTHTFFYTPLKGKKHHVPYKVAPPRPDYGSPDGYDFFLRLGPLSNVDAKYFKGEVPYWHTVMEHDTYDEFWKARRLEPHLKDIKPAVLIVGGWFDAEDLYGTLATYHRIEAFSPKSANNLVMGPWIHGGWNGGQNNGASLGPVAFDAPTVEFYREKIELAFFEYHLKGKGTWQPAEALMFETGTNKWREHGVWPPKDTKPFTLYFHAQGRLAVEPPAGSGPTPAFDEYVSDPARPVPYTEQISFRMAPEYMAADQRFAARRPDVLVYQTEALEQETTLAGPIGVDLHVSTTGTDSDWVVKVIDVYPDDYPDPSPNPAGVRLGGYQQLVRGEVLRGKYRNSLERPEPFQPGKATQIEFALPDVYHTFRRGHRIMVQVQSTWFPLVDRNPQKFMNIFRATESDFQTATQRVYRSSSLASRITAQRLP